MAVNQNTGNGFIVLKKMPHIYDHKFAMEGNKIYY